MEQLLEAAVVLGDGGGAGPNVLRPVDAGSTWTPVLTGPVGGIASKN